MAAPQCVCEAADTLGSVLSTNLAKVGTSLANVTILDTAEAVTQMDTWLRAAHPDDDRIAGDADAAMQLAEACGKLPLTLRIVAALLQADQALRPIDLADKLTAVRQRLLGDRDDKGAGPEASDVVAVFELAYRTLLEPEARVFRLLPLHPGSDVSLSTAEVLTDRPASMVRHALAALTRVHLIEAAPNGRDSWRMDDLVRLYARQLSDAYARVDRREQALAALG
jgi:hypothetical protein